VYVLFSILQSHDLIEPVDVSVNCVPSFTQAGVWVKAAVNLDGKARRASWVQSQQGLALVVPDQRGTKSELGMLGMEGSKGNQIDRQLGRCDLTTTVMVV